MDRFEVKLVGEVQYKTGVMDIENKKVPGFTLKVEANCNQFPDLGEFINEIDGNVKRVTLKSKDGNLKVNFDAAIGDCSIVTRVEFAGEDAIRVIKIPITISRRYVEDKIVELLDIFGEGDAIIEMSTVQLSMRLNKKEGKEAKPTGAPQGNLEVEVKKTPAPDPARTTRATVGRKPKGFDKSLN